MNRQSLKSLFLTLLVCFCGISPLWAQQIRIELGPDEIALNQAFPITITVENGKLESYEGFPDIPGFVKIGTSSSSSTNFINGQMSSSVSITQNYQAKGEGTFELSPFSMTINGKQHQSPGKNIKVGPAVQRRQQFDPFSSDPFQDFFNRGQGQPQEFVDVKDDAFFAVTSNKKNVYLGEGFTVNVAFYVSENNRADLEFYNVGEQLTGILKKIRPINCWEENYNIDKIAGVPVQIKGKNYKKYSIYEGTFYPLNLEDIHIPSVELELLKYKLAKQRSFFGRNRQEGYKTYHSKPITIKVKDLPPHPLKDMVAVGDYRLRESINNKELKTGESFNYSFKIRGEGNISSINNPSVMRGKNFDFYDPDVSQQINRSNGRVRGTKTYNYFGIPKEPGEYKLKDYFKWIYFNPKTATYDTLRPKTIVNVMGESKINEAIMASDMGSFYELADIESNSFSSIVSQEYIRIFANIFILIMLAASIIILIKK
ncbi:BatD family protein [Xanthovirga aplysinae]|uniref:BatD family protein n=1 Tax=Xanthovirga aplysinae TaxID=2529853 RepID=UPI0012BB5707|nr:BatD family protein [Xanthovirga aplysinae]MTI31295.1 hypothetical protein [Xanthovirga aplysinae]